jgi:hypothetical protein
MSQDYSDWLKQRTYFGVSQTYSDATNDATSKVDLGVIYSIGVRYSLLSFRGANVAGCSLEGLSGNTYISSYVGNDTN